MLLALVLLVFIYFLVDFGSGYGSIGFYFVFLVYVCVPYVFFDFVDLRALLDDVFLGSASLQYLHLRVSLSFFVVHLDRHHARSGS